MSVDQLSCGKEYTYLAYFHAYTGTSSYKEWIRSNIDDFNPIFRDFQRCTIYSNHGFCDIFLPLSHLSCKNIQLNNKTIYFYYFHVVSRVWKTSTHSLSHRLTCRSVLKDALYDKVNRYLVYIEFCKITENLQTQFRKQLFNLKVSSFLLSQRFLFELHLLSNDLVKRNIEVWKSNCLL